MEIQMMDRTFTLTLSASRLFFIPLPFHPPFFCRHNTTMEALREWLPDDLLHYCQTNSLLGEVLGETSSTGSPSLPTAEVRGFAAGTEDRPQYHATASRKTRS